MNRFLRGRFFCASCNPLTPSYIGATLIIIIYTLYLLHYYYTYLNLHVNPIFPILNPLCMKKSSTINMFRLKKLAGVTLVCCLFVVGLIV